MVTKKKLAFQFVKVLLFFSPFILSFGTESMNVHSSQFLFCKLQAASPLFSSLLWVTKFISQ